jgi:uncharacterized protein
MKYFEKIKNYVINFTKKGLTPHEIAMGLALGVLIAFVPVMGTHTILAIGLASLLRLSPLIVLVGTQISNPLSYPFQLFLCAEVGNLILKGYFLEITFSKNFKYLLSHYLWPIVVGSVVLGMLASGISYVVIKFFLNKRKHPA